MQHSDILAIAGLRIDGRRNVDIRQVKLKLGVANAADGSCYFEQGLNKVLAIIHGPLELQRRGDDSNEKGSLIVRLINAPFSGSDRRKRKAGERKTVEMEVIVRQTFESVVMLESYPRSEINVVVHVLESDGYVLLLNIPTLRLQLIQAAIYSWGTSRKCWRDPCLIRSFYLIILSTLSFPFYYDTPPNIPIISLLLASLIFRCISNPVSQISCVCNNKCCVRCLDG